jgi:hypothetical protein
MMMHKSMNLQVAPNLEAPQGTTQAMPHNVSLSELTRSSMAEIPQVEYDFRETLANLEKRLPLGANLQAWIIS